MTKNFENNIVLTSQNPEAFLVFDYGGFDTSVNPVMSSTYTDLYINGWDGATLNDASSGSLELSSSILTAPFHIFTDSKEDFDYNISFSYIESIDSSVNLVWDDGDWGGTVTIAGNNIIDASTSNVGDFLFSDPIPVSGVTYLDASIEYSLLGPGEPDPLFRIYQYGPGFTLDVSYDPFTLGWDGNIINISTSIDPSATNVVLFWTSPDNTSISHPCIFDVSSYWEIATPQATTTVDVSIFNRPFLLDSADFNSYETGSSLVDNEASYLLLRTNPKYSGNIKLMIDSSDNMFLDTFKVSDILSNKKYRKQKVSGYSYLSGDVRRVFETLPIGEIFRVDDENTLDLTHPKTEYYDQYNMTYSYGAQILVDELYEEEYSILAPLWINSKLPDYFVTFRLDGVFNEETYDLVYDLEDLANDYITNGELIESWNLKENQPIGKYLNNHLEELLNVEAPVNLSLNEYDPNTWTGMTVDKGIIAGRSEVPYFFQKVTDNFTDTNAFVSQGFERQNLLLPNLINMEFIFNDTDVSVYSMNRYFGLYLTENELYNFYYYKETDDSSINIVSLDGKDMQLFIDSSIFSDGDVADDYKNRIFVLNDGEKLTRICCTDQFNGDPSYAEQYTNELGTNIFNTYVEKKDINTYISLKLNNTLYQGEHLRIINNTQFKIWEIYGSNSDIFEAGEAGPYVSYNEPSAGYPTLYRTSFSTKGDISDQIKAIKTAFCYFNDYEDVQFHVGMTKDDSFSIIVDNNGDDYSFQRITSQIAFNIGDPSSTFNGTANPEDITFYGVLTPDSSDFSRILYDSSFGPIDLELYGDRMSISLNMFNPEGYNIYSFDASTTDSFADHVLYQTEDDINRLIQYFDVSTGIEYEFQYTEDPTSSENNAIIITQKEIMLDEDSIWWGYDVLPISISLMGINPVKDFDFTVYDSSTDGMDFKSDYWNNRNGDEATYEFTLDPAESKTINERNSYTITSGAGTITIDGSVQAFNAASSNFVFNTFFGDAIIYSSGNTTVTFNELDGTHTYSSYENGISEESIYDYYSDPSTKEELKYGLVVPTISKWGGLGKDVRNNDMRLSLTTDLFPNPDEIHSNFLASTDISTFNGEISYPIFKYLSAGEDNWKDYVYYDINDVVITTSGRKSIRELMFDEPYIDVFSKMLYNNNEISGNSLRSSILYYNLYENQVITLIKGMKLGLAVTATGEKLFNVTNWDRYRFSFITSPSKNIAHNYPIEIIVNENTETILMIWYQGNDLLSYTKRWSTTLGGKNILTNQNGIDDKKYQGFQTGDPSYCYVKSPFIVNTNSIIPSIESLYDTSTAYPESICSPFAQLSYDTTNQLSSIFNAYKFSGNTVLNSIFTFAPNTTFNTFDQNIVNYSYVNNSVSYGTDIINIGYHYSDNTNYYKNSTCDFDILEYFVDDNNIQYYIIQEDTITSSDVFSSPPLELTIYDPIEYNSPGTDSSLYIYNGSYKPIFHNILNFNNNETSELINIVEKDFIFSNSDLASYENINQYWYNKVVDKVRSSDSSNNIDYLDEFNPFKSLWDDEYYILDDDGVETEMPGFNSSLEVPSFFGSKLVSLPQEIILEDWNASNSKVTEGVDYYSIQYNLSKAIVDLFTNAIDFVENWDALPGVSDEIINRYIIKTILGYYNISINKIGVEAYSKTYNGSILERSNDGSFTDLIQNINSSLTTVNNEQLYTIKYDKDDEKTYYTKFTFTKK